MDIEWIRVRRRPDWPWWSIFLPTLWLALGGANLLLAARTGREVSLCLFKHLTGRPCPTCGFTRGVLSFLSGHPIQAWLHNPLLFSFLIGWGALIAARVLLGKRPIVHPNRRERTVAWFLAVLLFSSNWWYVTQYVG